MGRHWAVSRSGRARNQEPVCPLFDLQLLVGEGNQYFIQWNWHGNPDGQFFRVAIWAELGVWEEVNADDPHEASDVPWATGFYKGDFGCNLRAQALVAGFPAVVGATVAD